MKKITSIDEMRAIELDVMKKIHEFCINNDIQYFLSHGTLIGAVRHNGFIPWDDDVDIYMPRPDFVKFSQLFPQKEKILNLKLMTHEDIGRPVIKVTDNRTLVIETEYIDSPPVGVWVDIWPLDGISSNAIKQKLDLLRVCFYKRVLYFKKIAEIEGVINKITKLFVKAVPSSLANRRITKIMTLYSYEKSRDLICYCDPYKTKLKRQWFNSMELHKFENYNFCIPKGYDDILHAIYGDYMKLPPLDKQNPHHVFNAYWK